MHPLKIKIESELRWKLFFYLFLDWQYSFGAHVGVDNSFESPQFIENKNGGVSLVDSKGYRYLKNDSHKTKTYWRCSVHKSAKCTARAITEGLQVNFKGEHTHLPQQEMLPQPESFLQQKMFWNKVGIKILLVSWLPFVFFACFFSCWGSLR